MRIIGHVIRSDGYPLIVFDVAVVAMWFKMPPAVCNRDICQLTRSKSKSRLPLSNEQMCLNHFESWMNVKNKYRIYNQKSCLHLHFMAALSLVNELLDRCSSCNSAVQGCSMICAVLFPMLAFTATLTAFVLQDRTHRHCCFPAAAIAVYCNDFSWFALWINHRWFFCSVSINWRTIHSTHPKITII